MACNINVLGCNSHSMGFEFWDHIFAAGHFFPERFGCSNLQSTVGLLEKPWQTKQLNPSFLSRSTLAFPKWWCHFLIHLPSTRPSVLVAMILGRHTKMCRIYQCACTGKPILPVRFQVQHSKLRLEPLGLALTPMSRCWRTEVYGRFSTSTLIHIYIYVCVYVWKHLDYMR